MNEAEWRFKNGLWCQDYSKIKTLHYTHNDLNELKESKYFDWPNSLRKLAINNGLESFEIKHLYFPESITHFKIDTFIANFGYGEVIKLPNKLKILELGDYCETDIKCFVLPDSLKVIKFGRLYNHGIDHLPDNIETIILSEGFKKEINKLPKSLKYIHFGNAILGNKLVLPENLEVIKGGSSFVSTIEIILPKIKYVKGIAFRDNFNEIFPNLKYATVYVYSRKIINLPETLEYLKIVHGGVIDMNLSEFPENLKYLDIGKYNYDKIKKIPLNVKTLKIGESYNYPIDFECNLDKLVIRKMSEELVDSLPNGIRELKIGELKINLDNLPSSLELLTCEKILKGVKIKLPFGCKLNKKNELWDYQF
jgi:hypothetical protein